MSATYNIKSLFDKILTIQQASINKLNNNYYTKEETDAKFVTPGQLAEYGFSTSGSVPYVTTEQLEAKGYLTGVPSEYITETELNQKGYLTSSSIPADIVKQSEVTLSANTTTSGTVYTLSIGGASVGTINVDKEKYAKTGSYDANNKQFVITMNDNTTVTIPASDLIVDPYTEGNGIDIVNNVLSIQKDNASEKYLSVTSNGIKVTGIQTIENELTDLLSGSYLTTLNSRLDELEDILSAMEAE